MFWFRNKSISSCKGLLHFVLLVLIKLDNHRDGSFEYPQHMFWFRNKSGPATFCTVGFDKT